jgi:hypothetical protein
MKTYTVTYNVTLTIEVQAVSADEAERLADRELPSHCDVNCADARGQLGPLEATLPWPVPASRVGASQRSYGLLLPLPCSGRA